MSGIARKLMEVNKNSSNLAGFIPSDLTSCIAWYDSADSSTISLSGSVVVEWRDKISGLQNTNLGSPTYNSLNQEITVPLGANLDNTTTSLVSVNDPSLTYVFLVEFPVLETGTGINDRFFGLGGDSRDSGLQHAQVGAGLGGYSWRYQGGAFQALTSVSANTKYILSYSRLPKSTNEIFQNGTSVGSGTMTNEINLRQVGATGVRIGDPLRNGVNMETIFSEIIVLETVSTSDRQKCEGYIAHKWGQTALLPVGHPYKEVAP
jgi:hypothetical protein